MPHFSHSSREVGASPSETLSLDHPVLTARSTIEVRKGDAMNRFSVLLLLVALAVTVSCGNAGAGMAGTGRQLQSITITQTTNGQQIQFLATGTFSAPPTTVSPLPVAWTLGLMAP